MDLDARIAKLKERFPAGERQVLEHACKMPTLADAVEYLKSIYGNPVSQPSAWAQPLKIDTESEAKKKARARAVEPPRLKQNFAADTYKIKECKNKAGCNCDGYHHEFERRRNPAKYRYSEIPCPNVFKGGWKAPALCPKGDSCGHSHTVNEASYHPRTYKTKKCNKYEQGKCHYGDRCAFIHGSNDPIAAAWRRKQEDMMRPKPIKTEDMKVNLSSMVPSYRQEVSSSLSPSAWTFEPRSENPLEEVNLKMQKRIEELYLKTLCSICFQQEKGVALVPCGHMFCEECINQTYTAVCPVCRRDFTNKVIVYL